MKRKMLAGLILLNLCAISLDVTAGEVSITDQEVLGQLVDLRNFIDEKRDFTKQSAKGLKPVAVQYRSSASKVDGIVYCNLSFNTDALHLSIAGYSVQADGTPLSLIINVVYEWTDYVGYTIKSAKINATKTFALEDTTIDGDLDVDGDISGDSFDGDTQLEKIKDASGHNRYIEGEITKSTTASESITFSYAKWSLSGLHLLVVICGDIAENSEVPFTSPLCDISLPSWILDKIVPISGQILDYKSQNAYNDSEQLTQLTTRLYKVTDNLRVALSSVTTTAELHFRIAFDLLIDNEQSE